MSDKNPCGAGTSEVTSLAMNTCQVKLHTKEDEEAFADVMAAAARHLRNEKRETHLERCLKALLEYAEWLEDELGRMPSLSVLAARAALGMPTHPRQPEGTKPK